jgi:hypothetical protein
VSRHFDDLDAVLKSDSLDDFRQMIFALQSPPSFRGGSYELEHHQLGGSCRQGSCPHHPACGRPPAQQSGRPHPARKAIIRGRMAPGGLKIAASLRGRSRSLLVSRLHTWSFPTFCCSPEVAELRPIEPSYKACRRGITFRWRPVGKLLIELRLIGTWLHFQNDRRG